MKLRVYHRTAAAQQILREGFRDREDFYMTSTLWCGVWFSDTPLDVNEGAKGRQLLCLDIPRELFEEYEWVEDGKPYREALISAALINTIGTPRLVVECDSCPAYFVAEGEDERNAALLGRSRACPRCRDC